GETSVVFNADAYDAIADNTPYYFTVTASKDGYADATADAEAATLAVFGELTAEAAATATTLKSIDVSWSFAEDYEIPEDTAYSVTAYSDVDRTIVVGTMTPEEGEMTVVFDDSVYADIDNATTYYFTVTASKDGYLDVTADANATTLKAIPVPADEEVATDEPTADSIVVDWTPIAEEDQDLVSGYKVDVFDPDGELVQSVPVEGAASDTVTVGDLNPGTEYTFQVYAIPSAEGYGETLLGEGTGKTEYVDPVWDLSTYNFTTYVLSVSGEVVTLTGYAKNAKEGVVIGSSNVQTTNLPTIIGAQNAKENFIIADSAREYFENINVFGGGQKNYYVRRDTLVVSGSADDDVVTVDHVSGTGTILDNHDVLGSGSIQINDTANMVFSGMKQVLVNTEAGNDTFRVIEMNAYYTWLAAQPEEGVADNDILDFSKAVTINDRTDVTGAIVNLNATYQMVAGQNGRLKLAAGDLTVETVIGSKAVDTVISGKQGITFVDIADPATGYLGSRNIINLTRSETSNVVNVDGDHQTILGGKSDDNIFVDGDYCVINMAQDGDNMIVVNGDHNTILGGNGADLVSVAGSRNFINTLAGNDMVTLRDNGTEKADGNIVHLGNGSDVLLASLATGTDNKNFFYGEGGDDLIVGSAGNDYIYGGAGRSVLFGMAGKDYLYGGSGDDILAGNDFENLVDSLYADGNYNASGVETLVGAILDKIAEDDREGVLALTGAATADGEKDFMYRGGGLNHLFFQSVADKDFANPLTAGKNDDWVIDDQID
ncbi:MAG: fibronectin type III domain-containing protein, partial [Thermoguttaceae bacterium]|nr:fibronectin type III domain-containing protein [Thermoguttaceae bacterium]